MKRIFTLLAWLFFLSAGKTYSQDCVVLGCADAHTGIATDGTLISQLISSPGSGCFDPLTYTYKQIFWEFFYSPAGGDFTQTFTPTTPSDNLDMDWVVFQIPGGSPPASVHCPIDPSSWIEIKCSTISDPGNPTGPGIDGQATTIANRYYAVAIVIYQGLDNGGLASYGFDVGNPQINGIDLDVTNCPPIVLPVKISSFEARTNNCAVNLEWTAETETDLKNYEVQYSTDGTSFKTIATLSATENPGTPQKYSYTDANPAKGNVFYRLKMSDIDGKFDYSRIVTKKLDCIKSPFTVYPNPVTDILNINNTDSQNENVTVKLFDNNGRLIYNRKLVGGTNTINTHPLPKGIYLLQLNNGIEVQNIKIVK